MFIDETYKILYDMGLTTSEKSELATNKLKDVTQTLYIQWRNNRPLRGGPVTWEIFKKDLLNRFFLKGEEGTQIGEIHHSSSRDVRVYLTNYFELQ